MALLNTHINIFGILSTVISKAHLEETYWRVTISWRFNLGDEVEYASVHGFVLISSII